MKIEICSLYQIISTDTTASIDDITAGYGAGADPGFSWGGGGGGRLCARTHITSVEPNSLSAGAHIMQGPFECPRSSRVVLMLSHAILAVF